MQSDLNEINVLVYTAGNKICFLSSSVIAHGLLILKNAEGIVVKEKIISNTNSDYIIFSAGTKINKKATVSIISNEINYEKKLIL